MMIVMSTAFAQNSNVEKSRILVSEGKYKSAFMLLNSTPYNKLSPQNKALYNILKAQVYEAQDVEDSAYYYYIEAKKQYLAVDSTAAAMKINLQLAYFGEEHNKKFGLKPQQYLDEYLEYANKIKNPLTLANAYAELAANKINPEEYREGLKYFKKAREINKKLKNRDLDSRIDNNLAAIYNEYLEMPDSALYYFRRDLEYLKTKGLNYLIAENYINQAISYFYKDDHNTAIALLKKADSLKLEKMNMGIKSLIYNYLSTIYASAGNYKDAYANYMIYETYRDSLKTQDQAIAIADIELLYKTTEKELENTALKGKIKTSRILLYTFLGLTFATIIIGWLIVKNARRREKIAAQEKLIEQQKLEKALKDYELQSIDLMLEGQEKERERIANDLHDNLGSMLATLKLNFENLRLRKSEIAGEENKLYERTDALIEEAYQKVRRIAHAKNAGVIANKGLLPAIRKLAEKLTLPGKLTFQVVDFGFDERLENTLEIAIFRMVQELATNIIKHSQATEATIHLTHHDDNINIIIEDNGVGFNPADVKPDSGMGLDSIRKKTAQLGGTFTIDSTPGKGTTIVIDIPV